MYYDCRDVSLYKDQSDGPFIFYIKMKEYYAIYLTWTKQIQIKAIFSYPRLFLPLDKYSKIPLQLQKMAIGTQNTSIGTRKK